MSRQKYEDLRGIKFGQLTPIELCGRTKNGGVIWLCKCDCGNYIKVPAHRLKCGDSKSCGCYQREVASKLGKARRKSNVYIEHDSYYEGKLSNSGESFFFDKEDYETVSNYCWHLSADGYVASNTSTGLIKLHRLLFNFPKDPIDHKDRNKLNNRKENLRVVSNRQNAINSSVKKNNTSGITGVYFDKSRDKWVAVIKSYGKTIHLGRFVQKEDAIRARLQGELKYFGIEFAPQRHLFEQYGIEVDNEEQAN